MSKFTVGSQWRTRGGWRAVVVSKLASGGFGAWHDGVPQDAYHTPDGVTGNIGGGVFDSNNDLIEPWKDPIVHEGWFNFYRDGDAWSHKTKEKADKYNCKNRITCIKIKFTEGDGL